MTLLRTKIKREAKEVIRYTKRKVKKIAKKLSGKPKKKNPIVAKSSKLTFREMLSDFDGETRNLVRNAYKPYELVNEKRGIDYASPKQIADMIRSYLRDYSFNLNQYRKLMKVIEEVNQLPRNTEIYLPHTE